MANLQEIPSLDTDIEPEMNSWSTPPAGVFLLIEDGVSTDYFLLIDDSGNRLLIE